MPVLVGDSYVGPVGVTVVGGGLGSDTETGC